MPYIQSFALPHSHYVVQNNPSDLFTSGETYPLPLLPMIIIRSLDKSQTHYAFNSFAFTAVNNPVIYCSVNLSLSHHGTFELQIEDSTKTLNTDNLTNGARVTISMGKKKDSLHTHLSGMIRETGYTRGCENNLLYNIKGSGTGIRLNERILDVLMDTPKTTDGTTVDQTDPAFAAREVVDDAIDTSSYYPRGIYPSETESALGHIKSSTTVQNSDVTEFIPGVVLRFGEIQDLFNQIENYTGARIYVDNDDDVQILPVKTPQEINKGFRITTTINPDGDFADSTMYIRSEDYSFNDSISKDAGFSNSLYGLLPATVAPDDDTSSASSFLENKTVEIAMRFRPITNPNYRFYAGVEGVGMTNVQSENTVRGRWRICADDNGIPQNVGGILESRYMYPNKHYHTADGGLQVIQISKDNPSEDLDENTYYWMILSSVNATATEYWRWYYDSVGQGQVTATAAPGTTTSDDGGTGWTLNTQRNMVFEQGRFKTIPYNCLDPLSIRKRILIESVVPTFPQQIKTISGTIKYLTAIIAETARPKRVFDFSGLTVPNRPVFPGDFCMIQDSRFDFSTPGNRIVAGQITDINHSFGIKGGGSSPSSIGQNSLSLSVVGFPQEY